MVGVLSALGGYNGILGGLAWDHAADSESPVESVILKQMAAGWALTLASLALLAGMFLTESQRYADQSVLVASVLVLVAALLTVQFEKIPG
jgi:hypothetical protein